MAIKLYDDAIVAFIQSWSDKKLKILKPDQVARLFQMTDDQRKDEMLTMPLLMLSREPSITILSDKMQPRTFDGPKVVIDEEKDKTSRLNSVDVELRYQIDIFTQKFDEGDEFVRDLIFKFLNHPRLTITVPYNSVNYTHTFSLSLDNPVEDNSDIPQKLFDDQFTRWTLKIIVDDAKVWSVPVNKNYRIKEIIYDELDKSVEGIESSEVVIEE